MFLQTLPLVFVLAGVVLYTVLGRRGLRRRYLAAAVGPRRTRRTDP